MFIFSEFSFFAIVSKNIAKLQIIKLLINTIAYEKVVFF